MPKGAVRIRTQVDPGQNRGLSSGAERCLSQMDSGGWRQNSSSAEWEWPAPVRVDCGFRYRTGAEARRLLAGKHVLFICNSVQRRTMFALADLMGGSASPKLDTLPPGDQIFDQRKGYHSAQHLRVSAVDGQFSSPALLPDEYCGVGQTKDANLPR